MATKLWRCINHDACAHAERGAVLQLDPSQRVSCPECGTPLVSADPANAARSVPLPRVAAAALVVAVGAFAYSRHAVPSTAPVVRLAGAPSAAAAAPLVDDSAAGVLGAALLVADIEQAVCGEALQGLTSISTTLAEPVAAAPELRLPAGTEVVLRVLDRGSAGAAGLSLTVAHAVLGGQTLPLQGGTVSLPVRTPPGSTTPCLLAGTRASIPLAPTP